MELFTLLLFPLSLFTVITAVFLSKNPVYGVLAFVIVVAHVFLLLVLLDLEFLAYTLAIVYIGAIVVLFLFVIMMFYIYPFSWKRNIFKTLLEYYLLGSFVSYTGYFYLATVTGATCTDFLSVVYTQNVLVFMARFFFNELAILTLLAALIMLIGIVGAILITVTPRAISASNNTSFLISFTRNRNLVHSSIKKIS